MRSIQLTTKKTDELQDKLYQYFDKNQSPLGNQKFAEHILAWITFWRRNIHRFVLDYLQIPIHLYQIVMIYCMNLSSNICIIAARSSAKSFVIAIFACAKAILYPKSKIVIASATLSQSKLIITEKIKVELYDKSPNLRREIDYIRDGVNNSIVKFHNGSTIKVVPANENARGNRTTMLINEEARMEKKDVLDSVLQPMAMIRPAEFIHKEPYSQMEELREEPTTIFISSSWVQNHWLIQDVAKPYAKDMLNGGNSVLLCFDYAITLKHAIKTKEFMKNQKRMLDPMTFAIEYENLAPEQSLAAYYSFDIINQNQVLKRAFYPRKNIDFLTRTKNKYTIPKQDGEIRFVSCDIATIDRSENDNSVYTCIRMLPEVVKKTATGNEFTEYNLSVCYLEGHKGFETSKQAVRIRQLYEDFDADYIVLDMRSIGINVYDELAKIQYDEDRCIEYEPLSCMNDEVLDAPRIQSKKGNPVIYGVMGSLKLNSEMASTLRTYLSEKKINLLVSKNDAESEIDKIEPHYKTLPPEDQLWLEKPFLETMLLINELVNLEYEKMESTGLIRVHEKSNMCKDRYSSLAMGCLFASKLSRDLSQNSAEIPLSEAELCVSSIKF